MWKETAGYYLMAASVAMFVFFMGRLFALTFQCG